MPKKVLPVKNDLEKIAEALLPRGFLPIEGLEHFYFTTKDQVAIPPRPREGHELGFVFQSKNLSVVVWTSWLAATENARVSDCGWVLIEQSGDGVYFIPLHRTRHFAERLIMEAKIARCRIRNRPVCPVCMKPMIIAYGEGLGSRYWRCTIDRTREDWDTEKFLADLPEEAKQHLAKRRMSRARWQQICRKQGKPIRQAMLLRKEWRKVRLPITGF